METQSEVKRDENLVYAELQQATGDERRELEEELYKLLKAHAGSLVWIEMRKSRPDLVDEAVAKAFRNLGKFRGDAKLSTWFTHVVLNTIRSDVSKTKRRAEVPLEEGLVEARGNPSSALAAKLDMVKITESLTPEETQLLKWKLDNELESVIAAKVGLTTEGVRSRWFRLRKKILAKL